ncbi:LysM peptidoglycan-binding domain-containing protein [Mucilaginibacter sp. 14171R-50]|uniref:LysM peptidoglycan-binding domain-containing protein n=1 Tax=Mucilaginibacter sp. 14171R-50 TaxID=2703789 RepID=UPI00138CA254|nr:LysM peptidoglycan-binding domain-containing protein [Mucilaginibacter sp. 14171R-50]QHS57466.1 LysM peptidoglycan-binding domain-containing protein [Mucilaginibacter sp. 14171R-50]
MKFKILLLSTILLGLTSALYATALPDSIGVENLNGKKVILHKLDPKDNYYSIGRRYGVSPKIIQKFNNNAPLQIGHVIKVPTDRSIVEPTPVVQPPVTPVKPDNQGSVKTQQNKQQQPQSADQKAAPDTEKNNTAGATSQQYKVSAHETLYAIAKRFNTTVEALTALNKLKSNSLSTGQVILVPNGVAATPPRPAAEANADTAKRDSTYVSPDSLDRHIPTNRYGLFEKNEKGVATWIDDTSLDPNKKLILHRTAPIGTVMRITNPMNNRTTFAKVVGRFTDSQSTRDAIIVMTKNVAEALGALDKRFQVNISYGTPNE